jgi:hypothetical protein
MPISKILQMRAELQEILQEYELRDIWNCNKTVLFWCLLLCKIIAHLPIIGKKYPKKWVSILATCNVSDNKKLLLLFIHKYEIPYVLKKIKKKFLLFGITEIQKHGCKEVFLNTFLKNWIQKWKMAYYFINR